MAIKNKTRYAILGVLSMKAGSGYDIKKFCDKSISHFWNENFGHIYPVLAQLQKEGLIEQVKAEVPETDERRRVYGVTMKGKEELAQWLMRSIEYEPARSELLLKVTFGSYIPKEKMIQLLHEVRDHKKQQLNEYKNIEDAFSKDEKASGHDSYPYWISSVRYGIVVTEAVIRWCDETINSIERHSAKMTGLNT